MIMKISGFDMEIDINNEKTNILLISDSKLFGRICFDLTRNNDENIVFVLDNKIVNTKDILIISDIMNFDINNKMIISKLYNQMSNDLISDSDIENEIKKHYIEIVKKIYDEVDNYNVDININEELDFIKLFKMMGVEIHNSYDCLINKIIDLLEIYSELCNQTIVFINILNYFSNEEINEILKYIGSRGQKKGYYIEYMHDPFVPERIEHLLIPELNTCILTNNEISKCNFSQIDYNLSDYSKYAISGDKLSEIDYNSKLFYDLIDKSVKLINKAHSLHDELETYYISAMDFSVVDGIYDKVIKKLEKYYV